MNQPTRHDPAMAERANLGTTCPDIPGMSALPPPALSRDPLPHIPGYDLLNEIGRGGMGIVYRARQTDLGRLVALKVVLHAEHADGEMHARFRREAQAIARLQHPNIVVIHATGEIGELPYFCLEYCPGSLSGRLAQGPLQSREAAELVRSLALAVQAAHDQHVIHRDLKPANILIDAEGTPKVADFGLARTMIGSWQTASGAVLGTPSYMAPEQARGKTRYVGPATDVYSLGAILYECLTGRPPFREESALDTLMRVVSQPPPPLTQFRSDVPHDLEAICMQCLEKDPARRPSTARQLADCLEAYLQGRPCAFSSIPDIRLNGARHKAFERHRLSGTMAGVIVLLTLILGGCLLHHFWSMEGDAAESMKLAAPAGELVGPSPPAAASPPGDMKKAVPAGEKAAARPPGVEKALQNGVRDLAIASLPDLYGVMVGVNDYSRVGGGILANRHCAVASAEALHRAFLQQKGKAYRNVDVSVLRDRQATARRMLEELRTIGKKARRDDLAVIFLCGAMLEPGPAPKAAEARKFAFVFSDSNSKAPATCLTGQAMYDALAAMRCRKVVILDCVGIGGFTNVAREFRRDGVRVGEILMGCAPMQECLEPLPRFGTTSLFTRALIEGMDSRFQFADANRDGVLDLRELGNYVRKRMPEILKEFQLRPDEQTPTFDPELLAQLPIARR
jgi:serine/threonine-protein kinase